MRANAHFDMPLIISAALKRVQHRAFRDHLQEEALLFQMFAISCINYMTNTAGGGELRKLDLQDSLVAKSLYDLTKGFMTYRGAVAREAFFNSVDYTHAIAVITDELETAVKTAHGVQ